VYACEEVFHEKYIKLLLRFIIPLLIDNSNQLVFDKGAKIYDGEIAASSTKTVGKTG
jgi:hypothetical protein